MNIATLIGFGQFMVALLMWMEWGPQRMKDFLSNMAHREKVVWCLLLGGLAFSAFAIYRSYQDTKFQFNLNAPIEIITGREYINQTVELDGKGYTKCRFQNVTFKYNGTTGIRLSNNTIIGPSAITSDNPAVEGTFGLLKGLGMLPGVEFLNAPDNFRVEEPKIHQGGLEGRPHDTNSQ